MEPAVTQRARGAARTRSGDGAERVTPGRLLRAIGPGFVSGGADTDPTTVGTLSVIGATTGFELLWLVVLLIPMLVVVQAISARMGAVANAGLEDVVRRRYGRLWALVALVAVVSVSVVTLAADLEAGADALHLLIGPPYQWFLLPFAAAAAALLVRSTFTWLERVLKWVLLLFLAYAVTAFVARPDWSQVLLHTFVPHFSFSAAFTAGALALLGTTLTAYSYVWESIATAEEHPPLRRLGLVQVEAGSGMVFAGIIFYFILVTTGATLSPHHSQVQTAQDAAQALTPLAGRFSSLLFGVGLLASAVLAVPVLAGTCAYVTAEAFGWRRSLDSSFARARPFYLCLLGSLGVAAAIGAVGASPMTLLFIASIAGGLGTPITLVMMVLIGADGRTMGARRLPTWLLGAGWTVATIVSLSCLAFIVQTIVNR